MWALRKAMFHWPMSASLIQTFRAALKNTATSANDALAISHLPDTTTDPVVGGTQMLITVPLANMLGLSGQSPDGCTIYFNTNLFNFSRPDPNNDNCDMQSAAEHEMDEVLGGGGAGCNLNSFPQIGATDLFRYSTNSANSTLARSWTLSNGDNAYFSVDGTHLWARFNTTVGGDLGDFWGFNQDPSTFLPLYWSPRGTTPRAEVQDAYETASFFSYPGNFVNYPTTNYYYENTSPDLGTNELTMLDVIGWTLAANVAQPVGPAISIVRSGKNRITLSWPTNATGYSLQQSTNLSPGSWTASATGTKNPAAITISGTRTFYRLNNPDAKPAFAAARLPAVELSADPPLIRETSPSGAANHIERTLEGKLIFR